MSRRIALALSFSLTVVVSFAVMSFASQAGWLEAKSAAGSDDATLADEPVEPTAVPAEALQVEPIVITEYVYADAPARSEAPPAATPAPSPTAQPTAAGQPAASTASTTASAPPQSSPATKAPATTRGRTASDDDDDEHEEEHEDEHEEEHEDDDD